MVKCIECSLFSLQRVKEEEAIKGFGHCKRRASFVRNKAMLDRECDNFFAATPEVVAKRRSVIKIDKYSDID